MCLCYRRKENRRWILHKGTLSFPRQLHSQHPSTRTRYNYRADYYSIELIDNNYLNIARPRLFERRFWVSVFNSGSNSLPMDTNQLLQQLRDHTLEEGRAYIQEHIAELSDHQAIGELLADEATLFSLCLP